MAAAVSHPGRTMLEVSCTLMQMSKAWAAVLDVWAERFFQELDYQLEAYNTLTFQRQLADLPRIVIPQVCLWRVKSGRCCRCVLRAIRNGGTQ